MLIKQYRKQPLRGGEKLCAMTPSLDFPMVGYAEYRPKMR